jgi:hypothetical protein
MACSSDDSGGGTGNATVQQHVQAADSDGNGSMRSCATSL